MAERNLSFDALVLRTRESPSGDRVVSLLGAEAGIVDAFVFGGPKSGLRSAASPFVFGRALVYTDPVRQYRKLVDLSPSLGFPGLRDSYERLMAATAVSELILKTSGCGGDFPQVLELALGCLRALESADPSGCETALGSFLWRTLYLMGLRPDPSACAICGRALGEDRSGGLAYSRQALGFVCSTCSGGDMDLNPEEAKMLASLGSGSGDVAAGVEPGGGLSRFVRNLAQDAAEGPISSFSSSWAFRPGNEASPRG